MATIDFSAVPPNTSATPVRIDELSASAAQTGAAFTRQIESLMGTYAEAQARFSADADSFVKSSDPSTRAAALQLTKQRKAQQVFDFRRQLVISSSDLRGAMLKQLQGYADEATAILAVCASPAMMLGRIGLGDPRKTQLITQLRGAGPIELEAAARMAIMAPDIVLASAVALVVDRMQRDRRPFTVADFAQAVMGAQFEDASRKLKAVLFALRSAIAANREFERGAPDPLTNLALAISRGALKRSEGDSEPVAA